MTITNTVWKSMFRRHLLRVYASALRGWTARPLITTLALCVVGVTAAIAMDRKEFANVRPEVRQWFEGMRSPKGRVCCSYADGHRTGYDIRQGQYWVPINGEWYRVPPDVVIKATNPVGEAIVWYLPNFAPGFEDVFPGDKFEIICFIPSDGV